MSVKQSLLEGSLLQDYQNKAYEVLDYSLDDFSKSRYAFKFGKQVASLNIIGFNVRQDIQSYDYYTPKRNYSQSWSTSSFLTTKQRTYDDLGGNIVTYQANGSKLMSEAQPKKMSYDEYILRYGKLPQRKYQVVNKFLNKESRIHEAYLFPDMENSTNQRDIYGSLIYDIKEDTLKSQSLEKNDKGYLLSFDLDVRYALDHYALQMMNTGSLYELPKFTLSKIHVLLDENLHLKEVRCHDEFSGKTGFVSAKISMESMLLYFTSESQRFEYEGKSQVLEIPEPNSPFNADELFE